MRDVAGIWRLRVLGWVTAVRYSQNVRPPAMVDGGAVPSLGADMILGRTTSLLAAKDAVTEAERQAIRFGLGPVLEQLGHEVALLHAALAGPDPEFALSMFVDVLREIPGRLADLETALRPVAAVSAVRAVG